MDINQSILQELGAKIGSLEVQNAQLIAEIKFLQEELKNKEQKVTQ